MPDNEKLIEEAAKAIYGHNPEQQPWDGEPMSLAEAGDSHRANLARRQAEAALAVFEKAHTPTDDGRKLARAMARVEQLSDHLGIPYVYETGHGPVRPSTAPPVYLAADLWDALGAPPQDFDAYYERNRWADTWSNLLGTVRDHFRPTCGQDTEGERCVLTAGHLPPHYGSSDVGSSEPVPAANPQGEPSDARGIIARALMGEARMDTFGAWNLADDIVAALRAAGGVR